MEIEDMQKRAIESLANVGTDRAGMLAWELQRGMNAAAPYMLEASRGRVG